MVSPADAAAAWPKVQKLAAAFDPPLTLVSPSVASTGESGATDAWDKNGRSTWMDEFLGNCSEVVKDCDPSLIKYIGMHDYHGDVDMLRKKVDGAAKLYGRKVWITEVAITKYGDPPSRDMEDAYMKELLPYLDGSNNVFRYSWFSSRNAPNDQNGGSNLLDENGSSTLTSTGKIYRDTPDAAYTKAKTLRASPVTRKRGFAGFTGENFGCDDATLLGLDDSWSYSWAGNPTQHNKCSGQNVSAEFVPMVNGVPAIDSLNTDSYHSKWEEANAQFLLGYNEPDYGNGNNHPHMVSPADAAAAWPKVQKLAAAFDPP